MRRSSLFVIVCCAVTIGGCSKPAPRIAETATGEITPQAAPTPLVASDLTGQWKINATPEFNDTLVTHLILNATGDPSTWTIMYPPNPKPMKVQSVAFSGDSMVLDWGPYMSARKAGLKAVSHDVYRLIDGKLVGTSASHYVTKPDSIVRLRLEGTRAP